MTILQDVKAAAVEEPKPSDGKAPDVPVELDAATLSAASARGWVPKKHFKGDPEKWIDADKFLERAENELPLVKARNKKLEKQVSDLTALVGRVVKSNKEQQDRAVQQALAELEAKKETAIKEGDVDEVRKIDKKIDKAKAEAKEDEPAPDSGKAAIPEEFTEWVGKNKWFKESPRMRKYAEGVWDELKGDEDFSELPLEDQLKRITKEVKAQFPDKFQSKPKEPSAVEGGSGTLGGGGGKKGYADLPPEAKAICDDLIRSKVIKNRDEYLKDYRW